MRGRSSAIEISLSSEMRESLQDILRSRTVPSGLQRRVRAVLCIAEKISFTETQKLVGMTDPHLRKWCRRFLENGLEGLKDKPGRGRKPRFSPLGGGANCETGLRTS